VAHLIERLAQYLDRFRLRQRAQRFHQFRIAGRLHGGAIQLALNDAQIFSDSDHSCVQIVHLWIDSLGHVGFGLCC
jgi:hypothetical protein